ncbi:vacuolar alkaline phosphatase, partial [Coemansia thaxteri]
QRNLVFMISDGFGLASESMARAFVQQQSDSFPPEWASILDNLLVGTTRTRSSSTLVTDSAAGATAFSCAQKSFNGAIGVSRDRKPCATVLEAAKHSGYLTGLVSTARITHATPAAFAAHVVDRDMEELIAQQVIAYNASLVGGRGPTVDLMFGGGRCYFTPMNAGPQLGAESSCRSDQLDLWRFAQQAHGYTAISTRKQFDALAATPLSHKLPVLGLFANGHMAYEIDRKPTEEPSLTEMTIAALNMLHTAATGKNGTLGNAPGFFIMIEGARIDMAGHDNDPATHLRDIIEYWSAVAAVRAFVDANPDTLLISTSDHETGGLTLGIDPEYAWYPHVLGPVKQSADAICAQLRSLVKQPDQLRDSVTTQVLPLVLGIANATSYEVGRIVDAVAQGTKACKHAVGHVVSDRARVGWTTGGHTGVDVGLYAYGAESAGIRGSLENTQVGQLLATFLGVNTTALSPLLAHQTIEQEGFRRNKLLV